MRNQKTWVVDNSYAEAVEEAIRVARRDGAPGFVDRAGAGTAGGAVVIKNKKLACRCGGRLCAAPALAQQTKPRTLDELLKQVEKCARSRTRAFQTRAPSTNATATQRREDAMLQRAPSSTRGCLDATSQRLSDTTRPTSCASAI